MHVRARCAVVAHERAVVAGRLGEIGLEARGRFLEFGIRRLQRLQPAQPRAAHRPQWETDGVR